jgi:hypothetical protein
VVKFFRETGLLALCSNPQHAGVHILVAFYDMQGLRIGTLSFYKSRKFADQVNKATSMKGGRLEVECFPSGITSYSLNG